MTKVILFVNPYVII